ncbi:MAG: hypothetical protein ACRD1S_18440 [Vicinamibacterales bacterium]
MIWFFSRESELAKYEIRRPSAGAYQLVVTRSNAEMDMETEVESFADASRLIERSLEKQDEFRREGWQPQPLQIFTAVFAREMLQTA